MLSHDGYRVRPTDRFGNFHCLVQAGGGASQGGEVISRRGSHWGGIFWAEFLRFGFIIGQASLEEFIN